MQASEVQRAVAAAIAVARAAGLAADDAIVLHNSNKLALRLTPCDAFARVAPEGRHVAPFEVALAQRLAAAGCPAAALDPRVPPAVHEADGFAITFWAWYAPTASDVPPAAYADALARLHAGLRRIALPAPRFTDRVAEAEALVADPMLTPDLPGADRAFLAESLQSLRQAILQRAAPEQLLHGEPHPGNLLATGLGPLFIDLESGCSGPVEFDLAHAPEDIAAHYPGADAHLLSDCRALVLAMVAAWRWDRGDEFPNGPDWGRRLIATLRQGPPWPSLQAMGRRLGEM